MKSDAARRRRSHQSETVRGAGAPLIADHGCVPRVPANRPPIYALAVDELHTFFVGKAKILVHDNGCPRPGRGESAGECEATGDRAGRTNDIADFAGRTANPPVDCWSQRQFKT